MTRDLHPWAAALPALQAHVWTCLVRGAHDRRAPAHHPVLATVAPGGLPQARTVVLRRCDPQAGTLDIYTDLHAAKVAELGATPVAALHVWDRPAHLQIRLAAEAALLTGAQAAAIWAQVPDPVRSGFGSVPPTGQPIAAALDYAKDPGSGAFAVVRLRVQSMDILHLNRAYRRARFERADDWKGQWLAP